MMCDVHASHMQPLYSYGGRGKAAYILPSSDPTLALLLVGFTEYDDDDDDDDFEFFTFKH
ncbi:hypothetical protein Hanom_Chr15g01366821 [Helianthus anomalus]